LPDGNLHGCLGQEKGAEMADEKIPVFISFD
jgi:hypothetical protein